MFKNILLTALANFLVVGSFIGTAVPVFAVEVSEHGASSGHGQQSEVEDFSFDIEQR